MSATDEVIQVSVQNKKLRPCSENRIINIKCLARERSNIGECELYWLESGALSE